MLVDLLRPDLVEPATQRMPAISQAVLLAEGTHPGLSVDQVEGEEEWEPVTDVFRVPRAIRPGETASHGSLVHPAPATRVATVVIALLILEILALSL